MCERRFQVPPSTLLELAGISGGVDHNSFRAPRGRWAVVQLAAPERHSTDLRLRNIWIEITNHGQSHPTSHVALLRISKAEDVSLRDSTGRFPARARLGCIG